MFCKTFIYRPSIVSSFATESQTITAYWLLIREQHLCNLGKTSTCCTGHMLLEVFQVHYSKSHRTLYLF
jgi:hypothetical protein